LLKGRQFDEMRLSMKEFSLPIHLEKGKKKGADPATLKPQEVPPPKL
jgi:hypothetical protein